MKIIALDVGTKRIGIAKADTSVKIAVPYNTIEVDGTEFEQLARLSRVYGADTFVVGLPRNSEGQETAQSAYSRNFAAQLQKVLPNATFYFQDESLTSVEAEQRLASRKKNFKKGEVDTEAAVIILQDYLDNLERPRVAAHLVSTPEPEPYPVTEVSPKKVRQVRKKQQPKAPKKSRIIESIICGVVLVLGVGSFLGYNWYREQLKPVIPGVNCTNTPEAEACNHMIFQVADGEGIAQVAAHLESVGLIRNALSFQIYARLHGYAANLKAGDYEFQKSMSSEEILSMLVSGSTSGNVFRLTILPGETVSSIKKKLISIGYDSSELDRAFSANYDHPVLADKPENANLEGYIFGETYEFYIGASLEDIILTTLDELYRVVRTNDLVEKFAAQGLNLHEGIILASVVQKEANTIDQSTVAQVFLSRIANGIPLGSDVTTQYALDVVDPERKIYTDNAAALRVEECHNTRLYSGLPCGPISNPGTSALLAVANPSDTSYLYFLTGDDGMMYYSYTEAEHIQNIYSHCQVLCNVSL